MAREEDIPVIAFSNDRSAAGGGAYLASISPDEEVRRVMEYVAARGVDTFVFLGPRSDYGRQVEAAMRFEASRLGAVMAASAFYGEDSGAGAEARQIASVLKSELALLGTIPASGANRPCAAAIMLPQTPATRAPSPKPIVGSMAARQPIWLHWPMMQPH